MIATLARRPAIGLAALLAIAGLQGCTQQRDTGKFDPYPTIVLLVADDLGLDVAPCHAPDSVMKHLAAKCATSLVFDRAYTDPICTPSRASLMTGRHPFRTGAGDVRERSPKLSLDEETIAERIKRASPGNYQTAAFGKWHLADDENGADRNPNLQGFDYFEGTPRQHDTYRYYDYDWQRNGVSIGQQSTYRTTRIVDAVIEHAHQTDATGPGFYLVNFTNPHKPYHNPPAALHTQGELPATALREVAGREPGPGEYHANRREPRLDRQYDAMLEALDTEIERLVEEIDRVSEGPVIYIFFGDNGSAAEVYRGPSQAGYRAKGSLYEGGIRIPIQIWTSNGDQALVHSGRTDALVELSDLFLTITDLTGAEAPATGNDGAVLDSMSFANVLHDPASPSGRKYVYVERGNLDKLPFAYGLIDEAGYKLILRDPVRMTGYAGNVLMEAYNTAKDPGESDNLLLSPCHADLGRIKAMLAEISRLHASEPADKTSFSPDPYEAHLEDLAASCAINAQ
ncbi:sulfatase-like hydrolase/transferase [Hyphomonas chukchiensis]|uniref:sulfatase-like hydrolase/transferase n=1 Tax=Hyphomonas chukchiensis TaxID=1280947 RepID=UPI0030F70A9C